MKITANEKLFPVFLMLVMIISSLAFAGPKPTPADTTKPYDTSKYMETVAIEFPEKGDWTSGYLHRGENDSYMELYFPKGSSKESWTEMITIEKVGGKRNPNLPGAARTIFLGTQKGCPDATWKILEKGDKDLEHQFIVFEITCPKPLARQPPEIQVWKMIVGETGMFIVQYTYRGDEMPDAQRDVIKKAFDSAHIKDIEKNNEKEG